MEDVLILLVQDIVFAPAGMDMDLPLGDHVVEDVGVDPGGVHHGSRLKGARGGNHLPMAVGKLADGGHLRVAPELRPVFRRVLRKGHGQLVGADDAAGSHQQGFLGFLPHVGLPLPQLRLVDDPQLPPAAVLAALLQELLQGGMVLQAEGHHQGGVPLHGHVQLLVNPVEHGVAQHVELGLQGAGLGVIPAVDDGGVGLALTVADIVGLFQQQRLDPVPGQFPGNATAHHAAADDDHVIHFVHLSQPFFTYLLWPSQRRI